VERLRSCLLVNVPTHLPAASHVESLSDLTGPDATAVKGRNTVHFLVPWSHALFGRPNGHTPSELPPPRSLRSKILLRADAGA
jgi:hypothetical protein